MRTPLHLSLMLALVAALVVLPAQGGTALVAVAANFAKPVETLSERFEAATGHRLTVAQGSTGKLYAQIVRGAPYDILLAADSARPARLEAEGLAVRGSRFTYAVGRLVLWSPDPARIGPDGPAVLAAGDFAHLAIANPDLAPYGAAARQVLRRLGLADRLAGRIVMGQNIGQTFAMVATRNAELGLVAKSQIMQRRETDRGSVWEVPETLHDPIRQDGVLLRHGADNPAAAAFLAYLRSDGARAAIARLGYGGG